MFEYKNLLVHTEQGITVITINRSKFLNALNIATLEQLDRLFDV